MLPGKFAKGRVGKKYEVRSNLKNFTKDVDQSLHCVKFQVVKVLLFPSN